MNISSGKLPVLDFHARGAERFEHQVLRRSSASIFRISSVMTLDASGSRELIPAVCHGPSRFSYGSCTLSAFTSGMVSATNRESLPVDHPAPR